MAEPSPTPAPSGFGPNDWFVDEMYERYQADPGSVDQAWGEFFRDRSGNGSAAPAPADGGVRTAAKPTQPAPAQPITTSQPAAPAPKNQPAPAQPAPTSPPAAPAQEPTTPPASAGKPDVEPPFAEQRVDATPAEPGKSAPR